MALERNPDTLAQLAAEIEKTGGGMLAGGGDVTRRAGCEAGAGGGLSREGAGEPRGMHLTGATPGGRCSPRKSPRTPTCA